MKASAVTLLIFYVLYLIHLVANVVLIFWRGKLQPLKSRSVVLLFILFPTALFLTTFVMVRNVFQGPPEFHCAAFTFAWFVVTPAFWIYFLLKQWRLYNVYQLNNLKVKMGNQEFQERFITSITRLRRLAGTKSILLIFCSIEAVFLLSWVILFAVRPSFLLENIESGCGGLASICLYYFAGQVVFAATAQLGIVFLMRKERDDFGIKIENTFLSLVWFIYAILVLSALASSIRLYLSDFVFPISMGFMSLLWLEQTVCVTVPALMTFTLKYKRYSVGNREDNQQQQHDHIYLEMCRIMCDAELRQLFREFCKLQFNSENFDFFEDVQRFKVSTNLRSDAEAIFQKYVNLRAVLSINLPADIRDELTENIDANLTVNLFQRAEYHILTLLQQTYIRFRLTSECKAIETKRVAKMDIMQVAGLT